MQSVNKKIACKPFKSGGLKPEARGGLLTLKAKTALESLEVIYPYPPGGYVAGDLIYVRGDSTAHSWAKDVYTVNDVELVMVPEDAVMLADFVGPRPLVMEHFAPKLFVNAVPAPMFQGDSTGPLQPVPNLITSDVKPVGHGG